jgi:hypothetical protein
MVAGHGSVGLAHGPPAVPVRRPAAGGATTGDAAGAADSAPRRRRALARYLPLCLGCFALALAALLPGYVYPRLAVLPADPQQAQVQYATGATILVPDADSAAGARVVEDADVTVTTFVAGAPVARPEESVVWDLSTEVEVAGRGPVDARVERVSLDAHTAEPTNCCGDRLATDFGDPSGRSLVHHGLVAWPFGVQARDYPVWDVQLGRSRTAAFQGEETRDGVRTYRFQAATPFEDIGTRDLPGRLFRLQAPSVEAVEQYSSTRTYWVEPATGAVVDLREVLHQRFSYGGRQVTAFAATLESASLDAGLMGDVRTGARLLPWIHRRAPAGLAAAGLALLGVAAYRARPTSRSTKRSASRWASDIRPSP